MPYFDITENEHLDYLPERIRNRTDLGELADEAEILVIDAFRGSYNAAFMADYQAANELKLPYPYSLKRDDTVYLQYYEDNPEDVTNTEFKKRMAMTIARVIAMLGDEKDRETDVSFWSTLGDSETYKKRLKNELRLLKRYDLTRKYYGL